MLLRLPPGQQDSVMNGYDAWKTTPPWNKPADCPHACEDDCTCDDDGGAMKCANCGASLIWDKPHKIADGETVCDDCFGDIEANAAFDANPLGFSAKRSLLLYTDAQPFGSALHDISFLRGDAMAFWRKGLGDSKVLLVAMADGREPRHWKLTDFGWEVNLGRGLGTITPELELPEPIAELLALIAERGMRS